MHCTDMAPQTGAYSIVQTRVPVSVLGGVTIFPSVAPESTDPVVSIGIGMMSVPDVVEVIGVVTGVLVVQNPSEPNI